MRVEAPHDVGRDALELAEGVLAAAIEQARTRVVRGRPLGDYQAVAHCIAEHWTTLAAIGAARDACDSGDRGLAATLAAVEAALAVCDDTMRLRGAQGYLADDPAARGRLEAMRLLRRAGDREAILEHLGLPDREPLRRPDSHRDGVAAVLGPVWDDERALAADEAGVLHDPAVHRAVAGAGWLGVFVAHARLGELEPADAFAIAEELTVAGIPVYALNTCAMAAALIRDLGSDHLRDVVFPALVDGTEVCALGYTEPHGGSDLADVRTVAERDPEGDGWVLRGVKRYCTLAEVADHVLVLARSDPSSERHRGLTLFCVPLASGGFTIEELVTHGAERTTEVRLDGVRVSTDHVIGEVDRGWSAVMSAMRYERNATPWCDGLRLLMLADEAAAGVDTSLAWRRAVGRLYVALVQGRALVELLLGDEPGPWPSAVKLFTTEALVRSASELVAHAPDASLVTPAGRRLYALWRRAASLTIAGGASEVQRDIIAASIGITGAR